MPNLFAYGTLMCDDIMHEVCAHTLVGEPALLSGYSRRAVHEQPYPALIEWPADEVQGMLYRQIPDAVWARLDRFEGIMFTRPLVAVQLPSGEQAQAHVYVIKPEYRARVSDEQWDYERFLEKGRQQFESGYTGYTAL